jgi:hypothetical protein
MEKRSAFHHPAFANAARDRTTVEGAALFPPYKTCAQLMRDHDHPASGDDVDRITNPEGIPAITAVAISRKKPHRAQARHLKTDSRIPC